MLPSPQDPLQPILQLATSIECSFKNAHLTTPSQCPYPHPGLNLLNNWLPTTLVMITRLPEVVYVTPYYTTQPHPYFFTLTMMASFPCLGPLTLPLVTWLCTCSPSAGCCLSSSRQYWWSNSKGQAFSTNYVTSSLNILLIIQQKKIF